MNFLLQFIAVCLIALVVCWLGDTHFSTQRLREWRSILRYRWHRRVTCRLLGHRWDEITSGMLGACDRCFSDWPTLCRHCGEPVHGPDDWVSRNSKHRCYGSNQHHEV